MHSDTNTTQAPKRRPNTKPLTAQAAPKKRPSKLAKENNLTHDQESSIREAFTLFSTSHPSYPAPSSTSTTAPPGGALRTPDIRRCLIALNTPPTSSVELSEILTTVDPDETGFVGYETFLAVAALKLHARHKDHDDEDAEDDGDGHDEGGGRGEETGEAFRLFTRGEAEVITLAHLRRVARELREEVGDATLRDMIKEANGGNGNTVNFDDFENVMRRAGVFG